MDAKRGAGASAEAAGYSAEEAARLRRAVTLQNWDDGGELSRFVYLRTSEVFLTATIHRRGPVSELLDAPNASIGNYVVERQRDRALTLADLVASAPLDGLIVLHRGRVAYESYPRMRPHDQHLIFSLTKAFIGTAIGVLEDRGTIDLERPIDEYIRELKGTGWEEIAVRDILEMASGVEGAEAGPDAYREPGHRHYQLEASLGWLPKTPGVPAAVSREETYAYLAGYRRIREPGTRWEYASVNTAVLGWLLERATGKSVAEVLSEEIWSRIGAESDALMVVNRNGIAISHGGMVASLRDLARFGLVFTDSWRVVSQERVVSERLLRRIREGGRPRLFEGSAQPGWLSHPAYQWDGVGTKGEIYKGGFGGQLLYVAPHKDVVIACLGTNRRPEREPVGLPFHEMVEDLF